MAQATLHRMLRESMTATNEWGVLALEGKITHRRLTDTWRLLLEEAQEAYRAFDNCHKRVFPSTMSRSPERAAPQLPTLRRSASRKERQLLWQAKVTESRNRHLVVSREQVDSVRVVCGGLSYDVREILSMMALAGELIQLRPTFLEQRRGQPMQQFKWLESMMKGFRQDFWPAEAAGVPWPEGEKPRAEEGVGAILKC